MTSLTEKAPKSALITGASRRLGLYLTEHLLRDGWVVHAQTRKASDALVSLQCDRLFIYETQAYNEPAISTFVQTCRQQCAHLDLLVNNASIYETDDGFDAQGAAFFEKLFFIHMMMPALLVNGFLDALTAARGNVVSITDIYVANPNADYSLYCSSKAGLQNLTLGFAKKFAPQVRANCIQPGPIKFLDGHEQQYKEKVLCETLLEREGGFELILQTIKLLIANTYITGECIKVDGGRSLMRG